MTQPAPRIHLLDGAELRAAFVAAAAHLRESAAAVDAINVYPVPDGDTGSNMSATFSEAAEHTWAAGASPAVAEVLDSVARGALYGARGNSGVILSQALRGFASGAGAPERFDAAALNLGLRSAANAAYSAVTTPQEGTMLTVLRAAAEAAADFASGLPDWGHGAPCAAVLERATRGAEQAEEATMEQLDVLREAGVPDAGGEGICVILRGLLAAILGEAPSAERMPDRPISTLASHQGDALGFCTEFLIEPLHGSLDVEQLRTVALAGGNTSVVVVGDPAMARVHAHSAHPQSLLNAAAALGRLSRVKVEDMSAQHVRFDATGSGAGARVAALALSRGAGFDQIFRGLGAAVSDLGNVTKPPAGEIAAAADALAMADVIVLPNHKNVVPAARQAAMLSRCTLHVLATDSLAEGVASLVAFASDRSVPENLKAMDAARAGVRSVEVTIAAADRRAEGIDVRRGQPIALVDGRLAAAHADLSGALLAGLERAGAADGALITLYGGEGVTPAALDATRDAIAQAFPDAEVEAVDGGQPIYPYIASVER